MRRFRTIWRKGKTLILRWQKDGKLFGADWDVVAMFDDNVDNRERCIEIVRLMNKCDKNKKT